MSRRINSLENLRTLSPCGADWDSMRGGERVRFCEHCAQSVHDLSAMTRQEALRLVRESEGRLCVRYTTLTGGRVKTETSPAARLHQISRRASRVAAGAFGAALTLTAGASAAAAPAPATRNHASSADAAHASARAGARLSESVNSGASLNGTITDPNGAVIPFAAVTLVGDGFTLSATVSDEGIYRFAGISAGTYTLTASASGFQTAERAGLSFGGNEEGRIDLQLDLATITEELTVNGETQTVTMGAVAIAVAAEPLVRAASEDDLNEVLRLLADGADARVRDGATGSTALDEAVERGNLPMVRALLDAGADARARSKVGLTALMRLYSAGSPEIVRALVERGADANARDDDGDTPLGHAARHENPAVLLALVEAGAQLDAANDDGQTALMIAAEAGSLENVRALIGAGADVFCKDEDEKTALAYALENDHEAVAELLRARGAVE